MSSRRTLFGAGATWLVAGAIAVSVPPLKEYNHYSKENIWKRQTVIVDSTRGISDKNKEKMKEEITKMLNETYFPKFPKDSMAIADRYVIERMVNAWINTRPLFPTREWDEMKSQGKKMLDGIPMAGKLISPWVNRVADPLAEKVMPENQFVFDEKSLIPIFQYLKSHCKRSPESYATEDGWVEDLRNEANSVQIKAFVNPITIGGFLAFLFGTAACLSATISAIGSAAKKAGKTIFIRKPKKKKELSHAKQKGLDAKLLDVVSHSDLASPYYYEMKLRKTNAKPSNFLLIKLAYALYNHEKKKIERLLMAGADANVKDEHQASVLAIASGRGHTDNVSMLIEKGADIEAEDNRGRTSLMKASCGNYTDTVSLLIEKGADIDAKDRDNCTALMMVAEKGNIDTVRLLLEKGADVNAKDRNGGTALMKAADNGHIEVCRMLIEGGADVNAKENNGETAFMKAASNEHMDTVRLLLEKGADINAKCDIMGWTALMHAILSEETDMCALLIEEGADLNARGKFDETVYMIAKDAGNAKILNLLKAAGAKE